MVLHIFMRSLTASVESGLTYSQFFKKATETVACNLLFAAHIFSTAPVYQG